ncbi:MAG: formylglycine-generating enzyme family protein [Planctomycetota bacterium]
MYFCWVAASDTRIFVGWWIYACRAVTTTRCYWGDDPKQTIVEKYAWRSGYPDGSTHPVGQKLPNPWGLYDMCGNVVEFCQDNVS